MRANEIYGCSQFRANGRGASMRFYSAPVLSPQPIGRHLFLLIGGATSSPFRGWGGGGRGKGRRAIVNMTDGRDDGISAASEQTSARVHPENLRLGSIQGDERRPRDDLERRQGLAARSTAANRYTWLREQTKSKRRKGCVL